MHEQQPPKNQYFSTSDTQELKVNNQEWKKILHPDLYHIARESGTEQPFSSPLEAFHEIGTYYCAVCGNPLFRSDAKFESNCGWPSFFEPITTKSIAYRTDHSFGMVRREITCVKCHSHLGHVFEDGPPPTGLRYCLNGISLYFAKK